MVDLWGLGEQIRGLRRQRLGNRAGEVHLAGRVVTEEVNDRTPRGPSLIANGSGRALRSRASESQQLGVVCVGYSDPSPNASCGLHLGADDWLSKPWHPEELIARVEAGVRRRRRIEAPHSPQPIHAGELEIVSHQ